MKQSPLSKAEILARELAERMGLDFIGITLAKEPAGRFLRLFVDTQNGITLDELEAYHRQMQPLVEDIDYDYMEVSSPGVDRALKSEADFERAAGSLIEIKFYRPINGAKSTRGELAGLVDGRVRLADGAEYDLKDVALAKPVVAIDEDALNQIDFSDEENDDG